MTAPLVEQAPAKLNLALHVRARRSDGYHALDTLFAFTRAGDTLAAEPADRITLTVDGPMASALAPDGNNLVLRAAQALAGATGAREGAAITLTKRLPVAAGLGGGSADAAAALRLLARLWGVVIPPGLAERLGADVPACLLSRTAFATGLGWPLEPVEPDGALRGLPVLLVNPRAALATAAVFRAWDGLDRGALGRGAPMDVVRAGRNDLTDAAIALVPAVRAILDLLARQPGATLVRMSGSGATCFALFEDAAARDAAAAAVAAARPDDWLLATELL